MKYLTERQRDILNFIRDFQKERGVAPTHREICDHFGFSSYGTVYKHLSLLQKKGLIRRDWNQKRGVELVEQPETRGTSSRESAPNARELPLFACRQRRDGGRQCQRGGHAQAPLPGRGEGPAAAGELHDESDLRRCPRRRGAGCGRWFDATVLNRFF